jgi:predicted alpha/beta superfamily hydrolase/glycosidase
MRPLFAVSLALTAALALLPATVTAADAAPSAPPSSVVHPAWSRSATIYEVNVRQYSSQGTFAAVEADLPRLKAMGVDILWIMPIHPIGQKERKGSLGSYYAVRDYQGVNPEFGTLADFKHLVTAAHAQGLRVIIDWVANHTAWDHPWVTEHPDWYKKNERGQIYPVTFGSGPSKEEWTDVVGLDFRHHALWTAMIDAMAWWLREADIDGFRCDVASLVPTPFWNEARAQLDRIKPVFMLAESDEPDLHAHAFDMTYDWTLYEAFKRIAKGEGDARDLRAWLAHPKKRYPADAYRMLFTSNHDINSWHGSDAELYGPAFKAMAVLAATLPGMPLVYSGQEAFFDKRLAFFEKDPIAWKQRELQPLYTELLQLKHAHPALRNGTEGAAAVPLDVGTDKVFAFERRQGADAVTVAVNLSGQARTVRVPGRGESKLAPWGWQLWTRPSTALPNVHVLPQRFVMPGLGRERTLRVYLPPSYGQGERRYPVIYMHDGQNLFDEATSYAGEWGVDEAMNRLAAERGFEAIVVGIDNGGDKRMTELNPWSNTRFGTGEGEAYVSFIVNVVKPYIDATYRTQPGRETTAVMGSSMGGLISDYAIHRHPQVFGKAGVFSPSYWIAPEAYAYASQHPLPADARVYLYMGGREGEESVPDVQRMVEVLAQAPQRQAFTLHLVPEAQHNEAAWRAEFERAVRWMFEL